MYDKIAIVRKIDDGMAPPVNELAQVVSRYGKLNNIPVFDHHMGTNLPNFAMDVLFVSLGGDGTMLYTANTSMQYENTGIIGFNLGNLGFLTEEIDKPVNHEVFQRVPNPVVSKAYIEDAIFDFLDAIFDGSTADVKPDTRMMLEVSVHRDGMELFNANGGSRNFYAMNEVTVYTSLRNFITTTVAVNSMPVGRFGGNGVTVTTATGSTALGLSAGGAIISPNTNVMQIVPLLPHKVATQPVITTGRDEIIIRAETSSRSKQIYALTDSRQVTRLNYDNNEQFLDVKVTRAKKDVTIWRPATWNFFDVLSQKMGWN